MKKQAVYLGLLGVVLSSGLAEAGWGHGGFRPGFGYRPPVYVRPYPIVSPIYPIYRRPYYACSPEVKASTASAAEKILTEVAHTPDFANSAQFQEYVKSTSAITDADEKLHSYLSMVGVDSHDAQAVATFIGARDLNPYIATAEKTMGLTPAQADILVEKFKASALESLTQ